MLEQGGYIISSVLSSWLGTLDGKYGQCYEIVVNGRKAAVCRPLDKTDWVATWANGRGDDPSGLAQAIKGAKADWPGAEK